MYSLGINYMLDSKWNGKKNRTCQHIEITRERKWPVFVEESHIFSVSRNASNLTGFLINKHLQPLIRQGRVFISSRRGETLSSCWLWIVAIVVSERNVQ